MTGNCIPIEKEKEILIAVNKLIEEEVYLNSGLDINSLAKMINTNRQYLSVVINKHFKSNFNQLINYYRIIYAIKIFNVDVDRKYTIENVISDVGFSNRTSFIEAFKRHTGKTPSMYRKEISEC